MPKYRLDPPISGIFVPEVGAFNVGEDGLFDLPAVAAVEKALAEMGVTATEVVEQALTPPSDGADGATTVAGGEGADSLGGAGGATTVAGAEAAAPKAKGKPKGGA